MLGAHGVQDVILSISHRSEAIRAIMARETLGAVRLRDVVETEPLGTAGGVRNAADLVERARGGDERRRPHGPRP